MCSRPKTVKVQASEKELTDRIAPIPEAALQEIGAPRQRAVERVLKARTRGISAFGTTDLGRFEAFRR